MRKQINEIYFVMSEHGHLTAVINNSFSVARSKVKGKYNLYDSITKGSPVDSTPELVQEFTEVLQGRENKKVLKAQQIAQEEAIREEKITDEIKKAVKGITPEVLEILYDISCKSLNGSGSKRALIISNAQEYELIKYAAEVNNWDGEFAELIYIAGAHHYTPGSTYYNIEDWRKTLKFSFEERYSLINKENCEEWYLEKIKRTNNIDEITDIIKEYENMEEGYYDNSGEFVSIEPNNNNFFGYSYDNAIYSFGYIYELNN